MPPVNAGSPPLAVSHTPPCKRCRRTDSTSRVEIDGHAAPAVYSCDDCRYLFTVADGDDPASANRADQTDPEATAARCEFRDHVARTKFNRDLLDVLDSAKVLYDKLDAFSETHDCSTLSLELRRKGVLTADNEDDPTSQSFLSAEDYIPQDVAGFQWAVSMFLSVAEQYAIPLPATEADAIPFAVCGEGGAA